MTVTTGGDKRITQFKGLLSASPFIAKTLIKASVSDQKETSFLVLLACKGFADMIKDNRNTESIKIALSYILLFFWATLKRIIVCAPHNISNNGLILL